MRFTETSKEKLIEYWRGVETATGLVINYNERVTAITGRPDGASFDVVTTANTYASRAVLLTIGRRGTPRQLGVPGEALPKVVYRLIDPEQYRGRHVLVVGGGDSALEAACSIAEHPGATVTLSYRSPAFTRAKPKNRDKVARLEAAGRISVMMSSTVREIHQDSVVITANGESVILPNQGVIICAGGILPTGFLKDVGIDVNTKYGTA
jgi:thioredoxin reductase